MIRLKQGQPFTVQVAQNVPTIVFKKSNSGRFFLRAKIKDRIDNRFF